VTAHDWGGIVIHDATTVDQAEKAVSAGVDGLMLVCAGAGGLGGLLNPFAFVRASAPYLTASSNSPVGLPRGAISPQRKCWAPIWSAWERVSSRLWNLVSPMVTSRCW
jgi:hypothetical protein